MSGFEINKVIKTGMVNNRVLLLFFQNKSESKKKNKNVKKW